MDSVVSGRFPANDAQLIQNVRSALGRSGVTSRLNVSSCKFVVTLHGRAEDLEERAAIERVARDVPGVRGVENKLRVAAH